MTTSKSVKSKQKSVKSGKRKILAVVIAILIVLCGSGAVVIRYFDVDFSKYLQQKKAVFETKKTNSKDILAGSNGSVLSSGNAIKGTASVDLTNYGKNDLVNDITNENIENENSHNSFVEKLLPSVVHIKSIYLIDTEDQQKYRIMSAFGGDILPSRKTKATGSGSGFFISNDGYILTNFHVIDDAQDIDVEIKSGEKYKAKVIGYDEGSDLAVLKINSQKGEKFAKVEFGSSDDVNVGDKVIVVGGPLGHKWSVSSGIVSGKAREDFRVSNVGEFIQIDAAVNPGNSGGPAFNAKGQVIGVNTWGYGNSQGLNFAISQKTIDEVLPQIRKGKNMSRGFWGISVEEMDPWDVEALGLEKNEGMKIVEIAKGAPADKAGIKSGDVIVEINGKKITDKASMTQVNKYIMTDTKSTIKVNRYGEIKTFKNVSAIDKKLLEKLHKGEVGMLDFDDKMMSVRLITKKMHLQYGFPEDVHGVVVSSVKENKEPMFMLSVGDVITQINGYKTSTIEEYKEAVEKIRKDKKKMAIFHVYRPTTREKAIFGSKF